MSDVSAGVGTERTRPRVGCQEHTDLFRKGTTREGEQ